MVAFDASFLMLSIQPDAPAPLDSDTGHAVLFVADRVNQLLHSIGERGEVILIPTPVLSEILVHADAAGPDWLARIQRSPHFRVGDFDQRAAELVGIRMIRLRELPMPPESRGLA